LPFGQAQFASAVESGAAARGRGLGAALAGEARTDPATEERTKRSEIAVDVIVFFVNTFVRLFSTIMSESDI